MWADFWREHVVLLIGAVHKTPNQVLEVMEAAAQDRGHECLRLSVDKARNARFLSRLEEKVLAEGIPFIVTGQDVMVDIPPSTQAA